MTFQGLRLSRKLSENNTNEWISKYENGRWSLGNYSLIFKMVSRSRLKPFPNYKIVITMIQNRSKPEFGWRKLLIFTVSRLVTLLFYQFSANDFYTCRYNPNQSIATKKVWICVCPQCSNRPIRVFPPLALSIFHRFYGISFTMLIKKNITHLEQWLYMVKLSNFTCVVLTTSEFTWMVH